MLIKFLGTSAAEGWPALFCQCSSCQKARLLGGKNIRTRSSCIIDDQYMVDFSPDTYMHMITQNIDLTKVRKLIITHSHEDHFYANDLFMRLEPLAYINNMEPLCIYGNETVMKKFNDTRENRIIDGVLQFNEVFPYKTFKAGDAIITPLLANHTKFENCYIYIIELKGKKILYGHDTGIFPKQTWDVLKEHYFDCIILDCTNGPTTCGNVHMGFPENIVVKNKLIEYKSVNDETKFIITHFSHNVKLLHDELIQMAKPYGFEVAYDGLELLI